MNEIKKHIVVDFNKGVKSSYHFEEDMEIHMHMEIDERKNVKKVQINNIDPRSNTYI